VRLGGKWWCVPVLALGVLRKLARSLANKTELLLVLRTSPAHQQVDSYAQALAEGEVPIQALRNQI